MHAKTSKHPKFLTPLDLFLCGLVFAVVSTLFIFSIQNTLRDKNGAKLLEVKTSEGLFVYRLDEDRDLVFEGALGNTNVSIVQAQVDVTDSPGRKKICVNAPPISASGEWLACLPNRVFLRITGAGTSTPQDVGIDAMVY